MILTIKGQTYEKYTNNTQNPSFLIKTNIEFLSSHYNLGCFHGKR